jgi:pimeloyl-ACP methyl ester carboxylesterase
VWQIVVPRDHMNIAPAAAIPTDGDEVRLEHAIEMYRSLPDAELAVVPGTSHGLLVEKPDLCNLLITEFLTKEPVQTFAPIRRAAPAT